MIITLHLDPSVTLNAEASIEETLSEMLLISDDLREVSRIDIKHDTDTWIEGGEPKLLWKIMQKVYREIDKHQGYNTE